LDKANLVGETILVVEMQVERDWVRDKERGRIQRSLTGVGDWPGTQGAIRGAVLSQSFGAMEEERNRSEGVIKEKEKKTGWGGHGGGNEP